MGSALFFMQNVQPSKFLPLNRSVPDAFRGGGAVLHPATRRKIENVLAKRTRAAIVMAKALRQA
jgi:hypothetical protein